MTAIFWIIAALLVVLAAGFLLFPLLTTGTGFSAETRRIRARLASLDRAHADGHIDQATHDQRRAELKAELETLIEQPVTTPRSAVTALVLAVVVPLAAIGVYHKFGEPVALSDQPAARPAAATTPAPAAGADGAQAPELTEAIAGLAQRLEQDPGDVEGWILLGQSYMTVGEFEQARTALARAYEIAPDNPAVMEMYGTAIAFAAGDATVPEDSRALFRQALQQNPTSQRPLYFLGVAAYQDGEFQQALDYWERLNAQLTEGSPQAEQLAENINAARAELGLAATEPASGAFPFERIEPETQAAAETPAPAAAPVAEAPAAAAGAGGLTIEVTLDESLREQVSPSDVLFVYARAAEGPRMPLAIQRLPAGRLPVTVRLDESMAMTPNMTLSTFPQIVVEARISKSGNAVAQPGDLQALSDPVPNDRVDPIQLRIDRVL